MFQRENSLISNIFAPKKTQVWSVMQLLNERNTFAKKKLNKRAMEIVKSAAIAKPKAHRQKN